MKGPFDISGSTFTGNTLLHRCKVKMNVSSGIHILGKKLYGKTMGLGKLRLPTVRTLEFGQLTS